MTEAPSGVRDPARKELLVIGSQTSDVRRVVAALRRRWMVILAAVLVGAVLGLGYITAARPATYTTVVWLPPVGVKNLVGISEDAQPNIKQLVSDLSSASTYQLLGTAVEGAKVALAPDANELSIKVSASSDSPERAKAAASAFAAETGRLYFERRQAMVDAAKETVSMGLETAEPKDRPMLLMQKRALELVAAQKAPVTQDPTPAPTSATVFTAAVTLALLFAAAAAGAVGILSFSYRVLRFSDDVETMVGSEAVIAHALSAEDVPAVRGLLEDLAARGASIANVTPLAAPPVAPDTASTTGRPRRVLLARLDHDTKHQLDLSYRTSAVDHDVLVVCFSKPAWKAFQAPRSA